MEEKCFHNCTECRGDGGVSEQSILTGGGGAQTLDVTKL